MSTNSGKAHKEPSIYRSTGSDPADFFSEEQVQKSRDYNRPLTRIGIISTIITLVWVVAFVTLGGPQWLFERFGVEAWWVQVMVIGTALVVLAQLFSIPTSLYETFVHEEKWGFNNETPKTWMSDWIKSALLGSILIVALLEALWWVIRTVELWWIVGALVLTAFAVVLAAIAPVVIMPIFNKFTPIEDEELASHLKSLAERGGVSVSGIEVMDASKRTKHNNAFFAGMGKTRKLVIYDNMLDFDPELIDVVVAHEVGHWRHSHLRGSIAFGTLTTFLEFFILSWLLDRQPVLDRASVETIADPAAVPLFLLVFGILATFVSLADSWLSRVHERQADLFALELTRDPDSFEEVWRDFTKRDLAELTPSWWKRIRGSHPPIADRMAFAQAWREATDLEAKASG